MKPGPIVVHAAIDAGFGSSRVRLAKRSNSAITKSTSAGFAPDQRGVGC
jgi:hypothetical protein